MEQMEPRAGSGPAGGRTAGEGASIAGALRAHALAWARGRSWHVRLPLALWLGYILVRHLGAEEYTSLFGGLNLGIHELGHYLFAPLGELASIAGGTALQLFAPLIGAWLFWRQRDFFAIGVASCWLGTNLFNVAVYAADARARLLPLVSPATGDPIHDWSYMLGAVGLLAWDRQIGGLFRMAGTAAMGAGLLLCAWLLLAMYRQPE